MLLLDRLVNKTDLISAHVRQLFSLDQLGKHEESNNQDLQYFGAGLVAALYRFKASVQGMQERLAHTDISTYKTMARNLSELAVCEQPINTLVGLLRSQVRNVCACVRVCVRACVLCGRYISTTW